LTLLDVFVEELDSKVVCSKLHRTLYLGFLIQTVTHNNTLK